MKKYKVSGIVFNQDIEVEILTDQEEFVLYMAICKISKLKYADIDDVFIKSIEEI